MVCGNKAKKLVSLSCVGMWLWGSGAKNCWSYL